MSSRISSLVNTNLNSHSEGRGEQTENINHSLWWASDPREVPNPSTKTYSFITVTQLDMAIPVKRWRRDSLSLPLLLYCSLFLYAAFFTKNYALGAWFFTPVFLHFSCENVSFLDGHGGEKKDKKTEWENEHKSNKGLIGHAGRSQSIAGHLHKRSHTHPVMNTLTRTHREERGRFSNISKTKTPGDTFLRAASCTDKLRV